MHPSVLQRRPPQIIASASNDSTVFLWRHDAIKESAPQPPAQQQQQPAGVEAQAEGDGENDAAAPDKAGEDKGKGPWGAEQQHGWEAVAKIRGHAGHVNAVAFNNKGNRLASASEVTERRGRGRWCGNVR
jgi:hypothetical protein